MPQVSQKVEKKSNRPDLSLKVCNIERSIVNKKEPVLYYLKDEPKRGFVGEETQIVPLELSCLLKKFVDWKKIIKMSFSIDASIPDESIQETDKYMNKKKIVKLVNPTDNEDAANKKYVDEKRKQLIYSLFCQNTQKKISH